MKIGNQYQSVSTHKETMKQRLLLTIIIALVLALTLAFPSASLAINYTPPPKPSDGCSPNAVNTALGCISTNFDSVGGDSFIKSLINIAIGLGSGFALLLILYGVFMITTSAGVPEKIKEGSGIITSAIMGLLFVILSVFLMYLIGIQLLAIPGF